MKWIAHCIHASNTSQLVLDRMPTLFKALGSGYTPTCPLSIVVPLWTHRGDRNSQYSSSKAVPVQTHGTYLISMNEGIRGVSVRDPFAFPALADACLTPPVPPAGSKLPQSLARCWDILWPVNATLKRPCSGFLVAREDSAREDNRGLPAIPLVNHSLE